MSPHMRRRLADVFRWARANDWRPRYPRTRRDGQYVWTNEIPDPGNRQQSTMRVIVDAGGGLEVRQRMANGWVTLAVVRFGAWQTVPDVLAALYVIPHRYSTAYREGAREATRQIPVAPERVAGEAGPKLRQADSTSTEERP